ncbi:hypothetical protein E9531_02970, partial [Lampropedia puyangensis]
MPISHSLPLAPLGRPWSAVLLAASLCAVLGNAQAQTQTQTEPQRLYVNANAHADGNDDGSSWDNA